VFGLGGIGLNVVQGCKRVGMPALMRQAVEASNPFYGRTVIVGVAPQGAELSVTTSSIATGRVVGGLLMGGMRAKTDIPQLGEDYVRGEIDLDSLQAVGASLRTSS
jgi:S-(hydroxymethyl)glutathione dehydrogenase / alcohol dehydrogenase